ncbi:MAG: aspartate carbamoyltransferase catalytic subunit, partial [Mangrovicoccus sp.]|nr:aspartate carbamoyltransferase catalytic subunit [Mangrovicoccus sp.]
MGLAFPLLGLPFLALGLHRAGGRILWEAWRRRRTWYTLTSQRAFIATELFGRRDLQAYPMTPKTVLDRDGRNIWFAIDFVRTPRGSRRRKIGFSHLLDADRVFSLMAQVQRATT